MGEVKLKLRLLREPFAICRLAPDAAEPEWARGSKFSSITRTSHELSVICYQGVVPEGVECERDWRGLRVDGEWDFSMTGIVAATAAPLAEIDISLFSVSTYDTDYVFVMEEQLERALDALRSAGHSVMESDEPAASSTD